MVVRRAVVLGSHGQRSSATVATKILWSSLVRGEKMFGDNSHDFDSDPRSLFSY